jgi:hypothetical protein
MATESGNKRAGGSDKAAKNIVHEQAILIETIKKELREQKLCENFSINPFVKSNSRTNVDEIAIDLLSKLLSNLYLSYYLTRF